MKTITSRLAWIVAGVVLPATMVVLTAGRPEYCGPIDIPRPHAQTPTLAPVRTPTLAPRQNLVVVQVESDRPDIQISWVEN